MPAPQGNFEFDVLATPVGIDAIEKAEMKPVFPNPSHGITCIPVTLNKNTKGSIKLYDMLGNLVNVIYTGEMTSGQKNYFINTLGINAGAYLIVLETNENRTSQKLMIR